VYFSIALVAFISDAMFGEFGFIKHPVIFMGDFIKFYEKHFYKDSVIRGVILTFSLLFIVFLIVFILEYFVKNIYFLGLIASMGIASNMLYSSVKDILHNPQNINFWSVEIPRSYLKAI